MLTLQQTKDFLEIAKGISDQIDKERLHYNELFEDFQGLSKGLCAALDQLVDTMDKHLGDNEWVSWWVFECNFGGNPMEASSGHGEPLALVTSTDKLYELAVMEMYD